MFVTYGASLSILSISKVVVDSFPSLSVATTVWVPFSVYSIFCPFLIIASSTLISSIPDWSYAVT